MRPKECIIDVASAPPAENRVGNTCKHLTLYVFNFHHQGYNLFTNIFQKANVTATKHTKKSSF